MGMSVPGKRGTTKVNLETENRPPINRIRWSSQDCTLSGELIQANFRSTVMSVMKFNPDFVLALNTIRRLPIFKLILTFMPIGNLQLEPDTHIQ
jgi:hypothetical protein